MTILRGMFKNFRDGSSEVQREWKSQINQIDKAFETSLKACVKRSLQDLSKAINGDSKTEPQSLFTVRILLEKGVNYAPSMIDLTHNLNIVAKEIINVVTFFPRLRSQNFDEMSETLGAMDRLNKGETFVQGAANTPASGASFIASGARRGSTKAAGTCKWWWGW